METNSLTMKVLKFLLSQKKFQNEIYSSLSQGTLDIKFSWLMLHYIIRYKSKLFSFNVVLIERKKLMFHYLMSLSLINFIKFLFIS